jgi:hypothetical protein
MELALFNPSARVRLVAETDDERELLQRFRVARDPDKILDVAREEVGQEHFEVVFTIQQRQHAPTDVPCGQPDCIGLGWHDVPDVDLRFDDGRAVNPYTGSDWTGGVEVIRQNADYFLGTFVHDRDLSVSSDVTYGVEPIPDSRFLVGYVKNGDSRVKVSGLLDWMRQEWMRPDVTLMITRPELYHVQDAIDHYITGCVKKRDINGRWMTRLLALQRQIHDCTAHEYPPARAEIEARIQKACLRKQQAPPREDTPA